MIQELRFLIYILNISFEIFSQKEILSLMLYSYIIYQIAQIGASICVQFFNAFTWFFVMRLSLKNDKNLFHI